MSFFKRGENKPADSEPVLAVTVLNPVSSAIYQDMLRENGIPFICRQNGAGGYLKILFGGGLVPDNFYVTGEYLEKAQELYRVYIEPETQIEEEE